MSPDLGIFEFEQPSNSNHMEMRDTMHHPQFITPFLTQDDCDSPPSSNTHQHRKGTLTHDYYMLHMMDQPGYKPPFMPQQATGRRYPLQFLCDLAYAILNDETCDLIEYRHLMKHPKYKDMAYVIRNGDTPPCHDNGNHLLQAQGQDTAQP
jgi:hypothetical protein